MFLSSLIPETNGRVAVDAYARYLGISSSEFMGRTTLGKHPSMLLKRCQRRSKTLSAGLTLVLVRAGAAGRESHHWDS
jgi:hypothetical protein